MSHLIHILIHIHIHIHRLRLRFYNSIVNLSLDIFFLRRISIVASLFVYLVHRPP